MRSAADIAIGLKHDPEKYAAIISLRSRTLSLLAQIFVKTAPRDRKVRE